MLLIFFKRFNANPVYNFIIGILFFALFFLNSRLISFLYSQLGKQCICTHKMHFCLLGASPKPSESIRNLIELRLIGCINSILANDSGKAANASYDVLSSGLKSFRLLSIFPKISTTIQTYNP